MVRGMRRPTISENSLQRARSFECDHPLHTVSPPGTARLRTAPGVAGGGGPPDPNGYAGPHASDPGDPHGPFRSARGIPPHRLSVREPLPRPRISAITNPLRKAGGGVRSPQRVGKGDWPTFRPAPLARPGRQPRWRPPPRPAPAGSSLPAGEQPDAAVRHPRRDDPCRDDPRRDDPGRDNRSVRWRKRAGSLAVRTLLGGLLLAAFGILGTAAQGQTPAICRGHTAGHGPAEGRARESGRARDFGHAHLPPAGPGGPRGNPDER